MKLMSCNCDFSRTLNNSSSSGEIVQKEIDHYSNIALRYTFGKCRKYSDILTFDNVRSTVNSRYRGHSQDRDLVPVLANVRNSGVREKKS